MEPKMSSAERPAGTASRALTLSRSRAPRTGCSRYARASSSWPSSALRGRGPSSGGRLSGLALRRLLGRRRFDSAQVARLDDRRPAVAILPASLDENLLGFADQPKDDVEAGAGVVDRLHGALRRRERQERQDLAQVLLELLAEVRRRPVDVSRDERVAHGRGVLANDLFVHSVNLTLRSPQLCVGGQPRARRYPELAIARKSHGASKRGVR